MRLSFLSRPKVVSEMKYNIMVDCFDLPYNRKQYIYLQQEPEELISYREYLLQNWKIYYKIFTYDHVLLERCPNAVKYIFGNTTFKRIDDLFSIDIQKKKFQVSSLTGDKDQLVGHRLRRKLYENQLTFPNNFIFFVSHQSEKLKITDKNPKIYETKLPLFDTFQFSIVIECSQQLNYFSEKLIDCLLTKTIPIYWGCPNISEYFNISGWIFFNDMDILEKTIPLDHYSNYQNVIEENYHNALRYMNLFANLRRAGL